MSDPTAATDPAPARMSSALPAIPAEQDPSGFFKWVGAGCAAFSGAVLLLGARSGHLTGYDVVGALPTAVLAGICWRPGWMNGLLQYLADKAPSWITAYKKPV